MVSVTYNQICNYVKIKVLAQNHINFVETTDQFMIYGPIVQMINNANKLVILGIGHYLKFKSKNTINVAITNILHLLLHVWTYKHVKIHYRKIFVVKIKHLKWKNGIKVSHLVKLIVIVKFGRQSGIGQMKINLYHWNVELQETKH